MLRANGRHLSLVFIVISWLVLLCSQCALVKHYPPQPKQAKKKDAPTLPADIQTAETVRQTAEAGRQDAEEHRKESETDREKEEAKRQHAEKGREKAEIERENPGAPRQETQCCGSYMRTIVGLQQTGASSAESAQRFFLDVFTSRPLSFSYNKRGGQRKDQLGPLFRWWGDVEISSVPKQINDTTVQLVSTFSQSVGNLKVNEIAQSADFDTGLDMRLTSFHRPFQSASGSDRVSLSLITGGGASGILQTNDTPSIFAVPAANSPQLPLFLSIYTKRGFPVDANGAPTATHIGLYEPDRSHYYRHYFAGFRLMNHNLGQSGGMNDARAAMLDLTVGQDEAVTGGQLRGPVIRVNAFTPFQFGTGNKANDVIYFFATASLATNPVQTQNRVFLEPAVNVTATDPTVALVPIRHSTRDSYRLGVGIDLLRLIRNLATPPPPANVQVVGGDNQTAAVGTVYLSQFTVSVTDKNGKAVPSQSVTFEAPALGASGAFKDAGTTATVMTSAAGLATAPVFTANSTKGKYSVTARVTGVAMTAKFSVENVAGQ